MRERVRNAPTHLCRIVERCLSRRDPVGCCPPPPWLKAREQGTDPGSDIRVTLAHCVCMAHAKTFRWQANMRLILAGGEPGCGLAGGEDYRPKRDAEKRARATGERDPPAMQSQKSAAG
jgi:hypothetical protein